MRKESELIALLRRLDDPVHLEWPRGSDWEAAEDDFREVVPRLERAVDAALEAETGARIQDASFHGQVFLPPELLAPGAEPGGAPAAVVFSNFGRLVTVSREAEVDPSALAAIRAVTEAAGYVFVPWAILERPYDGPSTDATGGAFDNWAARFFDWM